MPWRARLLSIATFVAVAALSPAAHGAVIHSGGPLTDIWISPLGNCQVRHVTDGDTYEVYPPGSTAGNCFTKSVTRR